MEDKKEVLQTEVNNRNLVVLRYLSLYSFNYNIDKKSIDAYNEVDKFFWNN